LYKNDGQSSVLFQNPQLPDRKTNSHCLLLTPVFDVLLAVREIETFLFLHILHHLLSAYFVLGPEDAYE
jgi:hypothetical protein